MKDIIGILKEKQSFYSLGAATAEAVREAEQKLDLEFTDEYKQYVKTLGAVSFEGHELTGVCDSKRLNVVDVTAQERSYCSEIPKDWYVIEQTNMDGITIWQASDGVVFLAAPGKKPQKLANSLAEYVRS